MAYLPFRIQGAILLLLMLSGCADRPHEVPNRTPETLRSEIRTQYEGYRAEFPGVRGIGAEELVALRAKEEIVLVDVREEKERAVSMIPGAISREVFESKKGELRGRPIVAYCTIGYRSGKFVEQLNQEGVPALNLEGSILAWVNSGETVVDAEGKPTRRVHTYGAQWSLLPEGYEAVY